MSSLYQLFHNPLAVFAFICKHHPAVHSAINVIREEVANDGYVLRAEKGMSKKRLKDVYKILKKHNIGELRVRMAAQLKIYGNIWIKLNKDTFIKVFNKFHFIDLIKTNLIANEIKFGELNDDIDVFTNIIDRLDNIENVDELLTDIKIGRAHV